MFFARGLTAYLRWFVQNMDFARYCPFFLRRFYASFEITTSRETQKHEFDLLFTAIVTKLVPILFQYYF